MSKLRSSATGARPDLSHLEVAAAFFTAYGLLVAWLFAATAVDLLFRAG